jgi:hypothetical protein
MVGYYPTPLSCVPHDAKLTRIHIHPVDAGKRGNLAEPRYVVCRRLFAQVATLPATTPIVERVAPSSFGLGYRPVPHKQSCPVLEVVVDALGNTYTQTPNRNNPDIGGSMQPHKHAS